MGSHAKHGHGGDAYYGERGYARVPGLIQWMTTVRCPLSCPHCLAEAQDGEAEGELNLTQARCLIDQIAEMGVDELLLTGGEPLARADVHEVIRHLAHREVPFSLNTACMPRQEIRKALEAYPPRFVAVSLDGPEAVHDRFRGRDGAFKEAVAAMAYFASLGCEVVAGTTVTRLNVASLPQTLGIVARSAASAWGIHLLFPQGRAQARPDLFLSRRQTKRLLRFIAEKRAYYPLEMADEFGHCGELEPLVRDLPLSCGAGKTQCVILPDGEVVPCTTLDRKASAGNVLERPLSDIWEHGFAEIRRRKPDSRCAQCEFFAACGGGCWLQEGGKHRCHRDLWEMKPRLAAAGVLVALGLGPAACDSSSCGRQAPPRLQDDTSEQQDNTSEAQSEEPPRLRPLDLPDPFPYQPTKESSNCTSVASRIEREILIQYTDAAHADLRVPENRATDPAWRFLADFAGGSLPDGIVARTRRVREALRTRERSLAISALLYRALAEPILDAPPNRQRTGAEQTALRDTLLLLGRTTEEWRRDIFAGRLDPHFVPAASRPRCMRTKAAPQAWERLANDTDEERWPNLPPDLEAHGSAATNAGPAAGGIWDEWLQRHRLAEGLELRLSASEATWRLVGTSGPTRVTEDTTMGIFDVLQSAGEGEGAGEGETHIYVRWAGDPELRLELRVPCNAELTYPDLLRIAHEQHGPELDRQVIRGTARDQPHPLRLPGLRHSRGARWQVADFWLF